MIIEIENTSSPGASFTKNTNAVLLKTYEWICENKGLVLPFHDFRMRLQKDKGINDNNNRNIYPLLRNGGLATYEPGSSIHVDCFYTNTGLAYVKTLESIKFIIEDANYTKKQKEDAIKRFELIQNEIVYNSLKKIVAQPDINYVQPIQDMIDYLLRFEKINKTEYAYYLYVKHSRDRQKALETMVANVDSYRKGDLVIEVNVRVRNDLDLRKKTNSKQRKEGLSYLTSYNYFTSLLQQAGLITKIEGNYYCVIEEKRHLLEQLGGYSNDRD